MSDKYTIGQAVIYLANDKPELGFITGNDYPVLGYPVVNLKGSHVTHIGDDSKPATEGEILAEIQKHRWVKKWYNDKEYYGCSKMVSIYYSEFSQKWKGVHKPDTDNYYTLGNECLQAQKIITALNLAK
jgi:hypothetical protein